MFFWVFPRRQFVVGRRFGGSLPPAFEDGTDTGFRNVGQLQIDAGEIPKRTFSTRHLFDFFMSMTVDEHIFDKHELHIRLFLQTKSLNTMDYSDGVMPDHLNVML